jgi:hypothetical protein
MQPITDSQLTELVETKYGCVLHAYGGEFAPIDAYAVTEGRHVAYVERKTRPDVPSTRYDTAVIDARKWIGLLSAEFATGHPAILAYGWSDGVWGTIRPARGIEVVTAILTPGPESRSLNRGVPRPVVHVPIAAFELGRV